MADNNKRASHGWTFLPAGIGIGISGYNALTGSRNTQGERRSWFHNPLRPMQTARDYALSNRVVDSTTPSGLAMSRLQTMSQQRTWTSGLNAGWARRAVAESMRASLLADTRMSIAEINTLSSKILEPNLIPYVGADNIFDTALQTVGQYGKPEVFERLMSKYTSGGMPGEFLAKQETEQLLGVQSGTFTNPQMTRLVDAEQSMLARFTQTFNQATNQFGKSVFGVRQVGFYNFGNAKTAKFRLRINNATTDINLPLQSNVFYAKGSRAILPGIVTGRPSAGNLQTTSWGEYYARRLTSEVVPELVEATAGMPTRQARRIIKTRINKFNEELSSYFVRVPLGSSPGSNFINEMNANTLVVPELTEAVVQKTPGIAVDEEFARLYREGVPGVGQVFPMASGKAMTSGKVYAGVDPRSLYAYGREIPFERKPAQMIREFTPTPEALTFMRNRPILGVFRRDVPIATTGYRKMLINAGIVHPQVLTHYALPGKAASTLYNVSGLAQNEVLMAEELAPIFESQRIRNVQIGLEEAIGEGGGQTGLKDWLLSRTTGKTQEPYRLRPGEQIGYQPGRGAVIRASNLPEYVKESVVDAAVFDIQKADYMLDTEEVGKRFATLTVLEKHTGKPKTFGTHKATWRHETKDRLREIAVATGLHADNLETLTYIDDIRKSRGAVRQQMLGSLALETRDRLQQMRVLDRRRLRMNRLGQAFRGEHAQLESTRAEIWRLANLTNRKSRISMRRFLRSLGSASAMERMMPDELTMLARAKAWGLDIRNVGGVLPFAKDVIPADVIRRAERLAGPQGLIPESGWIRSFSTQGVGAYSHTSSGAIMDKVIQGTVEPRGLANLATNTWMVGKENAAQMLTGYIASSMGDYGKDLDELQLAARSALGQKIPDVPVANLSSKFELSSTGYMLNLGQELPALGGSSQIYVPGQETIRRLGTFRTPTGQVRGTELFNAYKRLHARAKAAVLESNTATAIASMNDAAEALTKAIARETTISLYGRGSGSGVKGALRNLVTGSAWLRMEGVDPGRQPYRDMTYFSERAGLEMFEQLEQRATGEKLAFIRRQKERFMRNEPIPGILSRHPTAGPYHIQPAMIMRSNQPDTATRAFFQVPEQIMKRAEVGGLGQVDVNISPTVGLFGDYDDDRIIGMIIGDQKTADATQKLLANNFTPYSRYAAEHTILTTLAKQQLDIAAPSTIYTDEAMALGGTKLRLAASEIGKISVPLTEARLAMTAHAPHMAPEFSMLSVIMEEQILKGKKMKTLRQNIAQRLATSMQNIQRAGDIEINELTRLTHEMFGKQLDVGVPIAMEGMEPWTFKLDARSMWKEVQGALQQGTQREGVVTRYRKIARQQGQRIALQEVLQEVRTAQAGTSDMLTNLAVRGMTGTQPVGRLSAGMRSVLTDLNEGVRRIGMTAKVWGKPALFGLAASASVAMLRSGPKAQPMTPPPVSQHSDVHALAQGDQQRSAIMMTGLSSSNRDLRPESIPMSDQVQGAPSAPGTPSPKMYMGNSQGYRVIARGSTSSAPDQATVAAAIRPVVPNANAQVTFRDNRRKMTSHDVENILEGP